MISAMTTRQVEEGSSALSAFARLKIEPDVC